MVIGTQKQRWEKPPNYMVELRIPGAYDLENFVEAAQPP
jgi:hypothetical protein